MCIRDSSGISHIAAAMGAKQITLVGVTDPSRTSPWNKSATILGSIENGWPTVENVINTIINLYQ